MMIMLPEVMTVMKLRASETFICRELATAGNDQAVVFTEDGRRISCWIASYNGDHQIVIADGADNYEVLSVGDITNIHISRDPRVFGYRSRP
jgi:hypothetical protein